MKIEEIEKLLEEIYEPKPVDFDKIFEKYFKNSGRPQTFAEIKAQRAAIYTERKHSSVH